MKEPSDLQVKYDAIITSVDTLNDTIHSTFARYEERLISMEKLLWVVQKKIIDQDKLLDALSSNSIFDQLIKRKQIHKNIKKLQLQSEEYRRSTGRAIREDEDDE